MPSTITPEEAADRLAIRELIDAYAHCADRRDARGQMALFTEDTALHVFMDSRTPEPTYVLHGREALAPVFADLNQYQATTHFNGQSTIRLDGDRATGESYCIAHHLTVKGEKRTLMLASIAGGAAGPWVTGVMHDVTGSYAPAFWMAIGGSAVSACPEDKGVGLWDEEDQFYYDELNLPDGRMVKLKH